MEVAANTRHAHASIAHCLERYAYFLLYLMDSLVADDNDDDYAYAYDYHDDMLFLAIVWSSEGNISVATEAVTICMMSKVKWIRLLLMSDLLFMIMTWLESWTPNWRIMTCHEEATFQIEWIQIE